jgi:4-amino-4-deoxy-L-arabinose transferase-like glycosyltransferase
MLSKTKRIFFMPPVILGAIVLLGGALRFVNISIQPFWGDEIFGLGVIKSYPSVSELINYIKFAEVYPPLYHIIFLFWTKFFGFETYAVRSISVAVGVAVILATYLLAKSLFEKKEVAYLAAFFVAILPSQIYFSQVIRPYIFFTLMAVLSLWAYSERIRTGRYLYTGLFMAFNLIGVYLHYSYFFFLVPLMMFWLIEVVVSRRNEWKKEFFEWLTVGSVLFLGFYPWLSTFLYKYEIGNQVLYGLSRGNQYLYRPISFSSEMVNQLIWTTTQQPFVLEVVATWLFKLSLVGSLVYAFQKNSQQIIHTLDNKKRELLLLLTVILGSVTLFIFSPYAFSYSPIYQQHILPTSVLIVVFFTYIVSILPRKLSLLVVSLFVVSLFNFIYLTLQDESNWNFAYRVKPVAEFINFNAHDSDLILTSFPIFRSDFNYYLRDELETKTFYPTNFNGNDELSKRLALGIFENEMHFRIGSLDKESAFKRFEYLTKDPEVNRVWLVFFNWNEYADQWFTQNGWEHKFYPVGRVRELMPFDLYVREDVSE